MNFCSCKKPGGQSKKEHGATRGRVSVSSISKLPYIRTLGLIFVYTTIWNGALKVHGLSKLDCESPLLIFDNTRHWPISASACVEYDREIARAFCKGTVWGPSKKQWRRGTEYHSLAIFLLVCALSCTPPFSTPFVISNNIIAVFERNFFCHNFITILILILYIYILKFVKKNKKLQKVN